MYYSLQSLHTHNMTFLQFMVDNKVGVLSVFGAFLTQLCAGCYHGTFGNMLPYLTSYMKLSSPHLTHGDMAMVFAVGGMAQGVSSFLGGLVFIPILGTRGSLVLGCLGYVAAPVLTYLALDTSVTVICLVYGILSSVSVNLILLGKVSPPPPSLVLIVSATFMIPVSWFPTHRGKIIGVINSGFGLSATVFAPIESLLVNPSNIPPASNMTNSSLSSYFTDRKVLNNTPNALLYLGKGKN